LLPATAFEGVLALEIGLKPGVIKPMSVTELKRAVDDLSVGERLELADYLRRSTRQNDPRWQEEIGRRLDSSLQGKGHTADELVALHDRLSREGR
jgi:hypothetical protein